MALLTHILGWVGIDNMMIQAQRKRYGRSGREGAHSSRRSGRVQPQAVTVESMMMMMMMMMEEWHQ